MLGVAQNVSLWYSFSWVRKSYVNISNDTHLSDCKRKPNGSFNCIGYAASLCVNCIMSRNNSTGVKCVYIFWNVSDIIFVSWKMVHQTPNVLKLDSCPYWRNFKLYMTANYIWGITVIIIMDWCKVFYFLELELSAFIENNSLKIYL